MEYWIGRRLESVRMACGMTQEALARTVGHCQSWMSDVLKGKTDPGFHEVEMMCRAMGVSFEELVRNPGALASVTIQLQVKAAEPHAPGPAERA